MTPQDTEILNFIEYSPFFWITGKHFKVCPRVMKSMGVDATVRAFDWPALPSLLFHGDPSSNYNDLVPAPSHVSDRKKQKWLSSSSRMKYLPQVWFQARRHPSTNKMKVEVCLLLEFATVLQRPVSPETAVLHFLLLFSYCCLAKSGVPVDRRPPPEPPGTMERIVGELGWMYSGGEAPSGDSESRSSQPSQPALTGIDERSMPSLADVRTCLERKPGPLFDPEAASRNRGSKGLSLLELLRILFLNPVVLTPNYVHPKRDVWVAGLLLFRTQLKSPQCSPILKILNKESVFLGTLLKVWENNVCFSNFWHCTASCFAKSPKEYFVISTSLSTPSDFVADSKDDLATFDVFPVSSVNRPSSSSRSTPSPSGNNTNVLPPPVVEFPAETSDLAAEEEKTGAVLLSARRRVTLAENRKFFDETVAELHAKAEGAFVVREFCSHVLWPRIVKACCVSALRYENSRPKSRTSHSMAVKFAVICSVHVGKILNLFNGKICWNEVVLHKFDKYSGDCRVKVDDLTRNSPFFVANQTGSKKQKLIPLDSKVVLDKVMTQSDLFLVQ